MVEGENQDYKRQLELLKQIEAIEAIAKQYMSREAISRYFTLKSAHLEIAIRAVTVIAQAGKQGQLPHPISDVDFKNILLQIQEPKKEFKIKK